LILKLKLTTTILGFYIFFGLEITITHLCTIWLFLGVEADLSTYCNRVCFCGVSGRVVTRKLWKSHQKGAFYAISRPVFTPERIRW